MNEGKKLSHLIHVVVWDVPSTIEEGEKFSIKAGIKCSAECRLDDCTMQINDHEGTQLASSTISDAAWPGSTALYFAELELTAPDTAGPYRWEARVAAIEKESLHKECIAGFNLQIVAAPECVINVQAIDRENQTPVKGAKVVVHPYRTLTDERGLAEVRVPRGEYRLFVSGKDYFPFRSDGEVNSDITIRVELAVDRELSDAELWS
ncbi:MAG: hypothetical protein O2971_12525 [Proteobacteria bacterium]|nr:hypothetical protein [Pseudomonadota bacterium]